MKLRLVQKRSEVGDVTTLMFEPQAPITWQAGQYLQYQLPHDQPDDRGSKRWFTISSAPYQGQVWISTRFFAKPSSFKHHLHELEVGQEIEAGEPEGDFVISDPSKSYVFIAGGIGITPFRSILTQAAYDGQALKVELLYGNRDRASSVFLDELEALARQNPNLIITNVIEPQRIDADMIKRLTDYRAKTYYVSGPEPMVEAFEKLLAELGIPTEQQMHDYFPGYEWSEPA